MMRPSTALRTSFRDFCAWVVTLLFGSMLLAFPGQAASASSCSTVTVPAYFYPGTLWDSSVQPATVKRTLIMNPASGPGTAPDPNYVTTVQTARNVGAAVVGYVHTSWGGRPMDLVLTDVQRYRDWYGVTSIFFDEASSSPAQLGYYETLSKNVRGAKGLVLLNPGVHPDEGYMLLADQVITFEGTYDTYRRAQVPGWTTKYSPDRFTHLVYSTHRRNMGNALSLAEKRRAGNVYVTNEGGTNPWDTLPAYWSDELTSLGSHCA